MNKYFDDSGLIMFECDNCGRRLNSCTFVNGMKFCAKCYQETFGNNSNPFEKELMDKLTDLEAKLAERDKELKLAQKLHTELFLSYEKLKDNSDQLKQQLAETDKLMQEYLSKCLSLEQQLAEKEQAIEGLQEINQSLGQTCNNDAKEIERLREQLAEKEKEIEDLKQTKLLDDLHDASLTLLIGDKTRADLWALVEEHAMRELVLEERIKQEKNQTAIAELKKVKEIFIKDCQKYSAFSILHDEFLMDIDQQIKELKGEK